MLEVSPDQKEASHRLAGLYRELGEPQKAIETMELQQAGTDQLHALAGAATNGAVAAMGMTNQTASTATNQVQALLDQAKNLTSNQKYQEALGTLTQVYNSKLTPDQQQQADSLKAQIQSSMTQKAGSALGGILGGKK